MLDWIRFGFCAFFLLAGLFVMIVSLIGLFRFGFALNRIHAAALSDTLSLLCFLIGTFIAIGFTAVAWKLLLILVAQWLTSPLSSHMLAQFEYNVNDNLAEHMDLRDAQYRKEVSDE